MGFFNELKRIRRMNKLLTANAQVANTTTATEVIATKFVRVTELDDSSLHVHMKLGGTFKNAASTDTLTITARYGTTTLLAIATAALAAATTTEASMVFEADFRVHTVGYSGKVVGNGRLDVNPATAQSVQGCIAAAGVSVVLNSENDFNVIAKWSAADAATLVNITHGHIMFDMDSDQ